MHPGSEADEILAKALEEDAKDHEQGRFKDIGSKYDDTLESVKSTSPEWDRRYGIAFLFWDSWGDARNHEWQYYEPIKRCDWPRLARHIAEHLRRGEPATDPLILSKFAPENLRRQRKPLSQWLREKYLQLTRRG